MTEHDLLLSWLSARGRVSTTEAREACLALGARSERADGWLRDLRRAGHIELEERRGWRVVSSTLVWRGRGEGVGELFGARDDELARALQEGGLDLERLPAPGAAEVWRVRGATPTARATCRALCVSWCREPSRALLAALPPARAALDAVEPTDHPEPTRGREWRRFVATGHRKRTGDWTRPRTVRRPNPGLWRSDAPQPMQYLWVQPSGDAAGGFEARKLRDREHRWLARWVVLAEGGSVALLLGCDGLSVPDWPRLPVLVERALRVASRQAPELVGEPGQGVRRFPGIDRARALEVARILGLRLEEADEQAG